MDLKIKRLSPLAKMPFYATAGSAAMDICALLPAPLTLAAGERALVKTGLALELQDSSHAAFVFARSGLATKAGICLANGVGVIDSDYRGELCVGLVNLSQVDVVIEDGERIAQLLVMPISQCNIVEAESLSQTERGRGGFGSTGK